MKGIERGNPSSAYLSRGFCKCSWHHVKDCAKYYRKETLARGGNASFYLVVIGAGVFNRGGDGHEWNWVAVERLGHPVDPEVDPVIRLPPGLLAVGFQDVQVAL